jgi:CRP/FNR family transcriptional regulator
VLFDEGMPAAGVYVVLTGRVKLVRTSPRGREQVLHVEGPGATLAEVPVFDGGGYVATAVAAEDGEVLLVPRDALLDLCGRHPAVALAVIRTLAHRVRHFAALIEDLALRDVTARLARCLLDESRQAGEGWFRLSGTRDEIAARLGTVRERVSRSLGTLRSLGLVEVRGRLVGIIDPGRLGRVARAAREALPRGVTGSDGF